MISEKHGSNRNNTQAISGTIHGETAVASPIPVKLYLLHVPLPEKKKTIQKDGLFLFSFVKEQDTDPSNCRCPVDICHPPA